jgi:hypothetical protein
MSRPNRVRLAAAAAVFVLGSACSTTVDRGNAHGAVPAEWFESLPSRRHTTVVDAHDELPRFEPHTRDASRATSRVVSVPPFVRLVASCNARVGAGGGFALDVRVSADTNAAWSPWCRLLTWGVDVGATADTALAFDGGRVAVDELLLEREQHRHQYRVVAVGDVELEHVCVCTSAAPRSTDASSFDAAWRPERPIELDVRPRSQKSQSAALAPRVCSPTSLAMALDWHGVDVPSHAVAGAVFDPANDIFGNWPRNVQGAFALGVPALLVRYDSWDAVEATFVRGLPIVASIGVEPGQLDGAPYTRTSGHLVVLRGIDANGDVLVADPAAAPNGEGADAPAPEALRTYRRAQLQTVWMERGGTAYVLLGR